MRANKWIRSLERRRKGLRHAVICSDSVLRHTTTFPVWGAENGGSSGKGRMTVLGGDVKVNVLPESRATSKSVERDAVHQGAHPKDNSDKGIRKYAKKVTRMFSRKTGGE